MTVACVTVPLGPACVNLDGIRAGDLNQVTIVLTQGGVPTDLTGLTATAQARKTAIDPTAIDAVCDIPDPTTGQVVMRWPGDAVETLLAGKATFKGVWDLQLVSAGADPTTVAAGTWLAYMDVTRP